MRTRRSPLTGTARKLRLESTDAERMLWRRLRGRQPDGCKFRRQHPVGRYIADFACLERKLIVELDGGQHSESVELDEARTRSLAQQGFRVIRFWNDEVLKDLEGVWVVIEEALRETAPHPSPLPASGERERSINRRRGP